MNNHSTKVLLNYFFYFISLFLIILLVNFIPDSFVWDRFNYYVFFENSTYYLDGMNSVSEYLKGEYIFHYINNYIYSFSENSFHTRTFYLTFICFCFTFFLFYNARNVFVYFVALFVSFFVLPLVHLNIVALRQALALYVFMFFFTFCNNKIINVFVLFLVSLIHNSFYYILIIYIINFFVINEKWSFKFRLFLNLTFFLVTSLLFIIVGKILGFSQIVDVYSLYGARGVGATFLFVLFIFCLLYRFFRDDFDDKFYIFSMVGLLNYLVFSVFVNASIAARYYEVYLPFLFFFLVSKSNSRALVVLLSFFLFYFVFHFSVDNLRSVYDVNKNIFIYLF